MIARATKRFKHPYIYPIYTFPFNFDFSGGNSLLFTPVLISDYSGKPRDLMSSWENILNIFSFHLLRFYEKIYGNGKKSDYRKRAYLQPYLKMRPKVMEPIKQKKEHTERIDDRMLNKYFHLKVEEFSYRWCLSTKFSLLQ